MLHFVPAVPSPRSNKNITKNPSLLSSLFYRISDFESKFDRRSNSRAETRCPESEFFFLRWLQCRGSVDFSFFFFSFYRKSAIVAQCFRFACETMRDARKTSTYILFFFFFRPAACLNNKTLNSWTIPGIWESTSNFSLHFFLSFFISKFFSCSPFLSFFQTIAVSTCTRLRV